MGSGWRRRSRSNPRSHSFRSSASGRAAFGSRRHSGSGGSGSGFSGYSGYSGSEVFGTLYFRNGPPLCVHGDLHGVLDVFLRIISWIKRRI